MKKIEDKMTKNEESRKNDEIKIYFKILSSKITLKIAQIVEGMYTRLMDAII